MEYVPAQQRFLISFLGVHSCTSEPNLRALASGVSSTGEDASASRAGGPPSREDADGSPSAAGAVGISVRSPGTSFALADFGAMVPIPALAAAA